MKLKMTYPKKMPYVVSTLARTMGLLTYIVPPFMLIEDVEARSLSNISTPKLYQGHQGQTYKLIPTIILTKRTPPTPHIPNITPNLLHKPPGIPLTTLPRRHRK